MSKFKKKIILIIGLTGLSSAVSQSIPTSMGMYDMKPKNSFRGGSIGKGGKIKYRRG